jgi:predicted Zn-dependent protease
LELIGVLMTHGEDYQAAIPYLEDAARDGRNVDRELGRAYLRTGRLEDARTRLSRVIAANPQDWSALADMGETHYQEGSFAPAADLLERSYTLYPYKPSVMETLARAMDKTGRRGAGFYYLAAAAEFRGDSTQATSYYTRAAETIPASDPLKSKVDERLAALEKEKPRIPPSHQRGPKAPRP